MVRWTSRAGTIDLCPALAALVNLVKFFIFLTLHFFTFLVPIAQQPRQAGVLGRLSPVSLVGTLSSLACYYIFRIYPLALPHDNFLPLLHQKT